jgi:hypothetical protein
MKSGYYWKVWQSFAVYLPVKSVGVIGDERNYADVISLRIVESRDAMTADWARLPYDLLAKISSRITNEVRGVSHAVADRDRGRVRGGAVPCLDAGVLLVLVGARGAGGEAKGKVGEAAQHPRDVSR